MTLPGLVLVLTLLGPPIAMVAFLVIVTVRHRLRMRAYRNAAERFRP